MISIATAPLPESALWFKTPLSVRNAVAPGTTPAPGPRTLTAPGPGPGTIRKIASTRLPTKWGEFQVLGFEREIYNAFGAGRVETALAMIMGDLNDIVSAPLVRIHSQCFTSESLGSLRCDCKEQLDIAMKAIAAEGRGLVIYENQEGRGIGLMAKLRAYALQDAGLDTIDANRALGFETDYRDFRFSASILHHLCISRVRLLTNNSQKSCALINAGIQVVAQIPCESKPNPHSFAYLRAKKERMNHALSLGGMETRHNGTGYANDAGAGAVAAAAAGQDQPEFASIDDAIAELQAGRMIVVVDDEDRENEGDLTMLADMVTPEAINFMAIHGRGLICLAMTGERLDELDLAAMTGDDANSALHGTAFTISIDAKGQDVTTGISAHDRAYTISAAINKNSCAEDFARPGHVFPLRARSGGVLERRGQTEAAVDLARLAGAGEHPAGVICEIINDDGTMARVPDLIRFCKKHDLLMITVEALVQHRLDLDDEESFIMFNRCFSKCA